MSNTKQRPILVALIIITLIIVVGLFNAINKGAEAQNPSAAADANNGRDNETMRVTLQSAKASFDAGGALFVDVRSREQYAASHITGAVLIPLAEIEGNEPDVPEDTLVITYCT